MKFNEELERWGGMCTFDVFYKRFSLNKNKN